MYGNNYGATHADRGKKEQFLVLPHGVARVLSIEVAPETLILKEDVWSALSAQAAAQVVRRDPQQSPKINHVKSPQSERRSEWFRLPHPPAL
jgi:hypothetical protein